MRDASLQPLTGITVAQGADQVEAHHGFESIQSIFVCRFQNRIQAKLVHESIQQINVPEDKRDQLSRDLQSGFALWHFDVRRSGKIASRFRIVLEQST